MITCHCMLLRLHGGAILAHLNASPHLEVNDLSVGNLPKGSSPLAKSQGRKKGLYENITMLLSNILRERICSTSSRQLYARTYVAASFTIEGLKDSEGGMIRRKNK